ncbi:MAG: class I SAM-dependent methyltransferase, partial [Planctomycetota bacterium]
LPLEDASCDVATVAFGIRNVADRRAGLREMARVVRPGGRVLVLELSMPPGALLGGLYRLYFDRILPGVGRLVSGDAAAYRYLPDTVMAWPSPEEFVREFEAEGLRDCGFRRLTRGICALHWGTVA